ncbi:exonuclease RecJ [Halorubrum sp. AD140]|uniref:exonuclease RecJ n=1 Tax=Halorubrum sp. AD140 TaxID=3050073 RepID=UPI002ACC7F01|nr:exonuclease RecJ [Halorubrum sp. AD140]MDZ5812381.1 exonuclease RecJ [Halorubrum sp. AD140]
MTEATSTTPAPNVLADVLVDAPFVRLVATDDGDALAAAGLLARALRAVGTPFQVRVSVDPIPDDAGDGVAVTVGADRGPHAIPGTGHPASADAFAVARALIVEPDPVVALAGVVAAGSVPGTDGSGDALDAAESSGRVRRRPGVAIPTADLADGLAASTLVRTPYSGDPEAARVALAELGLPADLDADAHRRLASLVAVDVADADGASARAATAVERALRPYATDGDAAPFETVGGYADVLDALAREAPGTGVALALDSDPSADLWTAALDAWRSHGLAAHRALDSATTGRYDGCVVVRVDLAGEEGGSGHGVAARDAAAVLPTVARLAHDFRSPEPVAVAVDESAGRLAAAASEPIGLGDACRSVAAEFGGDGWGVAERGGLAVGASGDRHGSETDDITGALAALREAL